MNCWCHECNKDNFVDCGNFKMPYSMTRMILCPDCGNKRCPKASNHDHECTKSNEPGQDGSFYGNYKHVRK